MEEDLTGDWVVNAGLVDSMAVCVIVELVVYVNTFI